MSQPLVLKLGGELVETAAARDRIAALAAATSAERPLVIVHGGGRAIDADLARRGITPKKADGLRVTDAATLEAVVAVLAGSTNTDLVASLVGRGVRAVGLTGVDAGFGRAERSSGHRAASGTTVDLGLVGDPTAVDPALILTLLDHRYVPVVASLGIAQNADAAVGAASQVLNVNADVMACRIAEALAPCDLVIAGATAGVLDGSGATICALDADEIQHLIDSGTATAGMVAKLAAARTAVLSGVTTVRIVDGRTFEAARGLEAAPGTPISAAGAITTAAGRGRER
ncbi:MAG: acetylglutamate kinase [Acidobacteriota bacterium]